MSQVNLSEILFKPSFKHRETSTLMSRERHAPVSFSSALEGTSQRNWYRMINRLMWVWRGINPIEIEQVLSRIAASDAPRSNDKLLDTVIGYRRGNWIYEWAHQAMEWQQKAQDEAEQRVSGECWLQAANLYGIAAYPHLKGDELAEQAVVLANRAYEEASKRLPYELRELLFEMDTGQSITGFLHIPDGGTGPFPTVLMCGGLDMMQSDHHRLYRHYLAPLGMAMLTLDMPSVGFSSRFNLTQDSSRLHQQVLNYLPNIPWIDHTKVVAFGFRFGANIAVRLAYLEAKRLRAVACLGPVVHHLLCDKRIHHRVPEMYVDMIASRLGVGSISDAALLVELSAYSLKNQGLLGRRCTTPMLAGFWDKDPFCSKAEAKLITDSSVEGKLMAIPLSPLSQCFDSALHQVCNWFCKYLHLRD